MFEVGVEPSCSLAFKLLARINFLIINHRIFRVGNPQPSLYDLVLEHLIFSNDYFTFLVFRFDLVQNLFIQRCFNDHP